MGEGEGGSSDKKSTNPSCDTVFSTRVSPLHLRFVPTIYFLIITQFYINFDNICGLKTVPKSFISCLKHQEWVNICLGGSFFPFVEIFPNPAASENVNEDWKFYLEKNPSFR